MGYHHCRADDTEIIGGVNVNPREIERLIVGTTLWAEAAVVAGREPTGASTLQAFLVPAADALIDELVLRDIHRRLLNRLSTFKGAAQVLPLSTDSLEPRTGSCCVALFAWESRETRFGNFR